MQLKIEIIKLSNDDVIATSSNECEFLDAEHFRIHGTQEYPDEAFSGTIYRTDTTTKTDMNYLKGQFSDQSGKEGWYHMDSVSGAFVWCNHQGHDDFENSRNWTN